MPVSLRPPSQKAQIALWLASSHRSEQTLSTVFLHQLCRCVCNKGHVGDNTGGGDCLVVTSQHQGSPASCVKEQRMNAGRVHLYFDWVFWYFHGNKKQEISYSTILDLWVSLWSTGPKHFLTHVRLSPSDGRCFQVVFYDCCDVEVCQMNVTCMKRHRICFYTFTFGNPKNPEMTQSCRITELRLHLQDWQKLFLFLGFIKFKDILHRSGILLCMLLMWVWDMQRPGSKEF